MYRRQKRREVIALLGGAAVWPVAAQGQQSERMRSTRDSISDNLLSLAEEVIE
jgi:hypothetical protein